MFGSHDTFRPRADSAAVMPKVFATALTKTGNYLAQLGTLFAWGTVHNYGDGTWRCNCIAVTHGGQTLLN